MAQQLAKQQLFWSRQLLCLFRTWHVDLAIAWIKRSNSKGFEVTNRPAIVFSPHQDDETFGCGGLIALKRQRGIPLQVVFLTNGAAYADDRDDLLAQMRQQEALNALEILGVAKSDAIFWDYPDGQLRHLRDDQQTQLIADIGKLLSGHEQTVEVYVPHGSDHHDDHEATYDLVQRSIAQTDQPCVVYQYPIWIFWKAPLLLRLLPQQLAGWRRLNIQTVVAQKQAAMAAHQSQMATLPPGFVNRFLRSEELFY